MNWRIFLFIPAIILGVLVFRFLQPAEEVAALADPEDRVVPVQAILPVERPVAISVEGFGRVEPVRTWEGVSQVDGRIIEIVDELAVGTIIQTGAEILRIDPRSYEIARDRAEANLRTAEAQLAELDAQVTTINEQLVLERRIEEVIQADFDRRSQLVESGTSAASSLDQPQRDLITQQRRILDLENQLELLPVQRVSAEATVRTREVELEDAERSLANTVITAPFTGRVLEEDASQGEYVRPGDRLLTLVGLEAVEIVAEIQPSEVGAALQLLLPDIATALQNIDFNDQDAAREALRAAGFETTVRAVQGGAAVSPAEIMRIDGTADEATGTVGIVVRVAQGGLPDVASRRPPLTNGSFVAVQFDAATPDAWLSVPRGALRYEGASTFLYVADGSNQLARRTVTNDRRISGQTVVVAELEDGDRIILSPPQPAILGQSLDVILRGAE